MTIAFQLIMGIIHIQKNNSKEGKITLLLQHHLYKVVFCISEMGRG